MINYLESVSTPLPSSFGKCLRYCDSDISEGWNINLLINCDLCLPVQLPPHYSSVLQQSMYSLDLQTPMRPPGKPAEVKSCPTARMASVHRYIIILVV